MFTSRSSSPLHSTFSLAAILIALIALSLLDYVSSACQTGHFTDQFGGNLWNAYIYTPADYCTNTNRYYPTIMYIPGLGEVGRDISLLLRFGPNAMIASNDWNGKATSATGEQVDFIVISLQPSGAWPDAFFMFGPIEEFMSEYRVDRRRFHMTGISMGGYSIGMYVTDRLELMRKVASVVVIQSATASDSPTWPNGWGTWVQNCGRYLGFEQIYDSVSSMKMKYVADIMNAAVNNSATYFLENVGGGGHCCFNTWYMPSYRKQFVLNGISGNWNIYEYMASHTMCDFSSTSSSTGGGGGGLPVSSTAAARSSSTFSSTRAAVSSSIVSSTLSSSLSSSRPSSVSSSSSSRVGFDQTLTTIGGWYTYIYLPSDYWISSTQYPLLIFMTGWAESGTAGNADPSLILRFGPNAMIDQGLWDGISTDSNGVTTQFIVASMQPSIKYPILSLDTRIDLIRTGYRVDQKRVHLVSTPMGGYSWGMYLQSNVLNMRTIASAVFVGWDPTPSDDPSFPGSFATWSQNCGNFLGYEQVNAAPGGNPSSMRQVVDLMNGARSGSAVYVSTNIGDGTNNDASYSSAFNPNTKYSYTLKGVTGNWNIYQFMATHRQCINYPTLSSTGGQGGQSSSSTGAAARSSSTFSSTAGAQLRSSSSSAASIVSSTFRSTAQVRSSTAVSSSRFSSSSSTAASQPQSSSAPVVTSSAPESATSSSPIPPTNATDPTLTDAASTNAFGFQAIISADADVPVFAGIIAVIALAVFYSMFKCRQRRMINRKHIGNYTLSDQYDQEGRQRVNTMANFRSNPAVQMSMQV